ncbi:glutamate dehydrogenase [Sulfodiicoccus acidiphilus]|uniref:Glutamate dehydrogenase n=1 Tax=Sulfodiicoccus acidiphilus TaxID=1670455 RepID=A0A348B5T7_9CREN|nr:Glu/Leu/Phe/Val dehydrogenase dimerization domain-containing protein [Sulfodiicoccus acidiphilus]BBD73539.1 glutamate dehydrogenase [Sulfodiicoccus acidiphilus]GGT92444.1 glutamate dehydrogenase [Sulfodiicoccus acidiphilus]
MFLEADGIVPDDLGPLGVFKFRDPSLNLDSVVVVDTAPHGVAAGGVRMLGDVTVKEVAQLARVMSYKFATFDIPIGGAKAGVLLDPRDGRRRAALRSFGRSAASLLKTGLYVPGEDMGTNAEDLAQIYDAAGVKDFSPSPLATKVVDGLPLEDQFTGFGVAVSARTALELAGMELNGAKVAVEGYGKVGRGVVRAIHRMGAKVVAVSTVEGTLYSPDGLDVQKLESMRREYGDSLVLHYGLPPLRREDLYSLDVDVLVPGARMHVIDGARLRSVRAKVIVEAANEPLTEEAEELAFRRGILVVPDLVANAGGVLSEVMARAVGVNDESAIFKFLEQTISSKVRDSLSVGRPPRLALIEEARRKLLTPTSVTDPVRELERRFGK